MKNHSVFANLYLYVLRTKQKKKEKKYIFLLFLLIHFSFQRRNSSRKMCKIRRRFLPFLHLIVDISFLNFFLSEIEKYCFSEKKNCICRECLLKNTNSGNLWKEFSNFVKVMVKYFSFMFLQKCRNTNDYN